MALTYEQRYNAVFEGSSSEGLEKRILMAMVDVAFEIGVEADGGNPALNIARRALATRVAQKPNEWLYSFKVLVASEYAGAGQATDAEIKTAIENSWDVVAGARNAG